MDAKWRNRILWAALAVQAIAVAFMLLGRWGVIDDEARLAGLELWKIHVALWPVAASLTAVPYFVKGDRRLRWVVTLLGSYFCFMLAAALLYAYGMSRF